MKSVRIMSDLHLEFGPLELEPSGGDVLVLAGDIGLQVEGARWAVEQSHRLGIPAVMVAGNHEFYRGDAPRGDMVSVYADLHEVAAKSGGGLTFLQNEAAEVAGIRFIGATLWTDFGLFDNPTAAMLAASIGMNDYRKINATSQQTFTPGIALGEHRKSVSFLADEFKSQQSMPSVVITHHAPSRKSIAGRYARDTYSPAYASNLDDLAASSGAALWVHGHVHHSFDYALGAARVRTNPRGYYGHEENPDFDPALVVTIGDSEEARAA